MNSFNFEKGDILKSTHNKLREGYHPIIYLGARSSKDFYGGMITREPGKGNLKMSEEHFILNNEKGIEYEIIFDESHLVPSLLIKFEKWGSFRKEGKLSSSGIAFVDQIIRELKLDPETFANYYRRTNTNK